MSFLRSYFLTPRFFFALSALAALFVLGYFFDTLTTLATVGTLTLALLVLLDTLLLYLPRISTLNATRQTPERFSNGDYNLITIFIQNPYNFTSRIDIIDELPVQFQARDFLYRMVLSAQASGECRYTVRPTERGEYHFGDINLFFESPLGLVQRRFKVAAATMVPTYPSFLQMRRYELFAFSSRATEIGIKRLRRLGHTLEFERIKPYTLGDDIRSINWKATARRGELMVNQYQDERSQPIYSLIDMGRVMKMPFEGLTLLDYAINASLAISSIALKKQDRVGLITFSSRLHTLLLAERYSGQLFKILETLYNQQTTFQESDYEMLFITVQRRVSQRALLLLFTNFETLSSMRRQLRYLQRLAARHLLVVIFFENTELRTLLHRPIQTLEDVYLKTIAEKFAFEKREIVLELQRNGIQSILTTPRNLTLNTINKYLELKARGLI